MPNSKNIHQYTKEQEIIKQKYLEWGLTNHNTLKVLKMYGELMKYVKWYNKWICYGLFTKNKNITETLLTAKRGKKKNKQLILPAINIKVKFTAKK